LNYPLDASLTPRFAGPTTFLRLPQRECASGLDVALFGVPFDTGASFRPGARFGPRAVRDISCLLRPYHAGLKVDPFRVLNVGDTGDVAVNPMRLEETFANITNYVNRCREYGAIPIAVGGDHSITLPLLRGVAEGHGPVGLLQFDAHLDTWDSYFSNRYTHGTFLRRAVEEGLVEGTRSVQVGIRGPLFGPEDLATEREMGLRVITAEEVASSPLSETVERVRSGLGDGPVYVTFDIDAVDPAYAPGTGTPEVGGMSSLQALLAVEGLVSLDIVGADVVEVAPAYDCGQITALLAARLLHQFVSVLAATRQGANST